MKFLNLLLVLVVTTFASERLVTDFVADFSGVTTDSTYVNEGWGTVLRIDTIGTVFSAVLDTNMLKSRGVIGLGAQGRVKAVGDNEFKIGWFYWESPHIGSGNNIRKADDIFMSEIILDGLNTEMDYSPVSIAKDEHPISENPPNSFDFFSDDSNRFIAYWAGFIGDSVRHSNARHTGILAAPTGLSNSGVDVEGSFGTSRGGEPAFDVMPGVVFEDTLTWRVALAFNLSESENGFQIRVEEPQRNILFGPDTVYTSNGNPSRYLQTKVSTNGTILVSWFEANFVSGNVLGKLFFSVYDSTLAPVAGLQSVEVADGVLGRGVSFEDLMLPTYGIEPIADDIYVLTYGDGSDVFVKTINTTTQVVSAPQLITTNCDDCYYPTLNISPDTTRMIISYFGNEDIRDSTDMAIGSIFNINNSPRSIDFGSKNTIPLSTKNVIYTHSYGKRIHFYGQVSASIDNLGNIMAAFNYEDQLWVNGWQNVNFYFDTAQYISGDLVIPAGFVLEPFDPARDSVQWKTARYGNDPNVTLRYQFSENSIYTSSPLVEVDPFGNFPTATKTSGNHYKYTFELRSSNQSRETPMIDSLRMDWNVRPRDIVIDSVQIGENPYLAFSNDTIYPVINRLDTVRIALSGFDYDDHDTLMLARFEGFDFIDSIPVSQPVSLEPEGFYRYEIVYLPRDTVAADLPVVLNWVDPEGWASRKDTVHFNYYNIPPEDSVFITFPKGANAGDSSEQVVEDKLYRIQMGDTTILRIVALDSNDTTVTVRVEDTDALVEFRDTLRVVDSTIALVPHDSLDTLAQLELGPGEIDLRIDTVLVILQDGDVQRVTEIFLVPNHIPWIDSMKTVSYMLPTGSFRDSLIYRNASVKDNRALDIIPYVPNRIVAYDRDPDEVNFDSSYVEWYLLQVNPDGSCCIDWPEPITTGDTLILGTPSLFNDSLIIPMGADTLKAIGRDSLINWYEKFNRLRMVTYDVTGAFREDTVGLRYPRLDTNLANNNFQIDLDSLNDAFNLILESDQQNKVIETQITSTGTSPLIIREVYTLNDQAQWLNYKLDWLDTTGTLSSQFVESKTDSSRVSSTAAVTLNQFQDLKITFDVDISGLSGDSIINDTLYLLTNDWFNPVLKVPIKLEYNDYPKVSVFYEPFDERDTSYTLDSLIDDIPLNGRLKFAFTEPVVEADIEDYIKIFSVPDNISRGLDGDSLTNHIQALGSRISLMQSKFNNTFQRVYSKRADGVTQTQYVDTLLFIPDYQTVSDSFKIRPGPESFVIGDSIHIWISSAIEDSTGNPLDLSLSAPPLDQILEDSLIVANIDASTFKVIERDLRPQPRQTLPPSDPIRIPFDSRLVPWNVLGEDSILSIDFDRLDGTNRTIRVVSKKSQWEPVILKSIQLENDDSTLVVYPKRHFFSKDSLRIQVFSNLSDWKGRTLNGNFDSTFTYLFWCYDTPDRNLNNLCKQGLGQDTVDQFVWEIEVGESGFYSFPNPYRHYREDHREIGGIVFKNLHKIKGITPDKPINIRVYTLNGQLVHSSKRKNRSVVFAEGADDAPQYIWDVKNNHGKFVATGLYIYVIESDGDVVEKGKIAVIR